MPRPNPFARLKPGSRPQRVYQPASPEAEEAQQAYLDEVEKTLVDARALYRRANAANRSNDPQGYIAYLTDALNTLGTVGQEMMGRLTPPASAMVAARGAQIALQVQDHLTRWRVEGQEVEQMLAQMRAMAQEE